MKSIRDSKIPKVGLWFILSIFVIISCLFSTYSHGGKKMEPLYLYDIKEAGILKPQEFKLNNGLFGGAYENISLFPVPQENTVGTNDMHNAITLISFHKGRISFDKYFKNVVNDIGGGGQYLPVISKDVIGFGQTRAFEIYDFKKKIHREYTITTSLAKTIEKVAIADARLRQFIFEIEKQNSSSHDPWDTTSTLQLMDLSGTESRQVKEKTIGSGITWAVVSDKNLLYNLEDNTLQVLNMNLEPAQHPLAELIKRNKGKIGFTRIHPHPSLPFAILCAGRDDALIVFWDKGRDKALASIFGDSANTAIQFSFSLDGKWVVFKEGGSMSTNKTYLMPVSEKYPNYLGSPMLIFNKYFNDNKSAWTTNPISFVGSRGETIYRWDLENQVYPGKDKMSFHDYIVQEDLKKLAKEKRQGLGERHK